MTTGPGTTSQRFSLSRRPRQPLRCAKRTAALAAVALALGVGSGCDETTATESIPIGLFLSYSGDLAANSINSERALAMAIEAANRGGGVGGRPVTLAARDTRSDPRKVSPLARDLINTGAAIFIGPDTTEIAVELKGLLSGRVLIMPSFTTADSNIYKPHSWFVMGAPAVRVACELFAQLQADGRKTPMVVADPNGYNSLLAYELTRAHGLVRVTLPTEQFSNEALVQPITAAGADAYVLAALPPSASSLFYALAATNTLGDPTRWYLSPTLHTPALLDTIPKGMLQGARGVATGTLAGANDFRESFFARWEDQALDDAYAFYDAGAIAVLALQRALVKEQTIPKDTGLSKHLVAVTQAMGTPVRWNEIDRGLLLLQQGQEVAYVGLTGSLEFDSSGQSRTAHTSWWQIEQAGFTSVASSSTCR
jgi:ABC-type branched-subunit amino acid transport system substrate-binding protein